MKTDIIVVDGVDGLTPDMLRNREIIFHVGDVVRSLRSGRNYIICETGYDGNPDYVTIVAHPWGYPLPMRVENLALESRFGA